MAKNTKERKQPEVRVGVLEKAHGLFACGHNYEFTTPQLKVEQKKLPTQ